ncbi:efflux RND transporter periplasmic adaptor subunit [Shewanella bicestrii]|uniref:efflux RND transporter periplasmic adaptor subunit n=1 Tax=Shewanella TaxID=22 RepID=UPI000B343023|nr:MULTISPECIES: efflux RND transporter periplasmic adaptor subunit [unclassified Shewanella]MDH0450145.1 efflux RND transporter periplasmic adaptor subunit [Shewanella sp. GD04112]MDH1471836.1 efflux RND transporter periplasmic adaptor subunit [Shewanella sp. GD03713]QXN25570.1 efflux RND transporter periplasmic adaptor subunit [Shewanella putrefaciens]
MKSYRLLPLAALLPAVLTACTPAESSVQASAIRPVKLFEVEQLEGGNLRTFPARVSANSRAELSFRISGELTVLALVEGQQIRQGSLLAKLDDRDAYNNLMTREADHELLEADFQRKTELLKRKLISQAEFDSAQAQLKSAKAALAAARDQLSYTKLIAPFSGTVAKRLVDNHQIVQANQGILTLQNNSLLDVSIQVPEAMAASLNNYIQQQNFTAKVRFSALADMEFDAKFKEYSTQVTPGTQAYEVVFSLPQPKDIQLLPGMSAELTLALVKTPDQTASAIVPVTAIDKRDQDGQVQVWVYQSQSGEVKPTAVTLGRVTTQGIEVLGGINKGDLIVSAGVSQLSDGMKVKPLRWQRGV